MFAFPHMCFIGLIVGAVAKLLMPGKDPGRLLVTMPVAIRGVIAAGYVGRMPGWDEEGEAE